MDSEEILIYVRQDGKENSTFDGAHVQENLSSVA